MTFITAAEAAKIAEASQPFTSSYLLEEINRNIENLAKLGEREVYYPSLKTRTSLDTIQKVQKDKSYINQANAICNVVSQMINIKKLELQLARNVR